MSSLDNSSLQQKLTEIVDNENAKLLEKKQAVDQEIDSKDRLKLLNNSTRKRGEHITKIVMAIVIILVLFTFLNIASESLPMVPEFVFIIHNFIIVAVGIIYIFSIFVDMQSRDKLYYDKYEFDHPIVDSPEEVQSKHAVRAQTAGSACVGIDCCPSIEVGTVSYDASQNLCVIKGESFINQSYKIPPTPINTPNEFEKYQKL